MKVISLQSGSNGNSFYVEAEDVALLFDAGITGRQAEARLAEHNRDIRDCSGLFISHDHSDHTKCMGVFHRKFNLPLYITRKTLRAACRNRAIGSLDETNVRFFAPGDVRNFETATGKTVSVHTVATPHDSAEGVAFVVEHDDKRVGILTDLGHVFPELRELLLSLDAAVIESNYDEEMLEYGPYPEPLKKRIRGRGGHISNHECADLISRASLFRRLKWACLCHLSEENNAPELALKTHRRIVGSSVEFHVASRDGVSGIMEV